VWSYHPVDVIPFVPVFADTVNVGAYLKELTTHVHLSVANRSFVSTPNGTGVVLASAAYPEDPHKSALLGQPT
jgi:hypothetical protein